MMNTLNKMNTEKMYLNIIKTMYDRPMANIILNTEKPKAFPLGQEQDKDVHLAAFSQQH